MVKRDTETVNVKFELAECVLGKRVYEEGGNLCFSKLPTLYTIADKVIVSSSQQPTIMYSYIQKITMQIQILYDFEFTQLT